MLDLQTQFDMSIVSKRYEVMLTSQQLTLGELTIELKHIENQELPVYFFGKKFFPTKLDSWRGSYRELAFGYARPNSISKAPTVKTVIQHLIKFIGATVEGYKGGEYLVGKVTPIWIANGGESEGFSGHTQGIVGVRQKDDYIVLLAKNIEY